MRELRYFVTPDSVSPETFSVMQPCTTNEPLLPNLRTLDLMEIKEWFIPFIPLFLSPRTTSITLGFGFNHPEAIIASTITTLPTLCPDLREIALYNLPGGPAITAAVSGMLLVANRNTLQEFCGYSPLTEEASEVLYKLPNLRSLSTAIKRETRLPSASLPNLTKLAIMCDDEDNWPRLFHGATLGKLEYVDFLGAFKGAALSSSIQNTLSRFLITARRPWNPSYSSLLPFTQLVDLGVEFSCDGGCPSRVDDDIVISLLRATSANRPITKWSDRRVSGFLRGKERFGHSCGSSPLLCGSRNGSAIPSRENLVSPGTRHSHCGPRGVRETHTRRTGVSVRLIIANTLACLSQLKNLLRKTP